MHIQLAFEGKGVGVKSGVILEGQTSALNTKQTNKRVNIVFGKMGLTLPSQTKNLVHKYIMGMCKNILS
jgi:hypothetical protein